MAIPRLLANARNTDGVGVACLRFFPDTDLGSGLVDQLDAMGFNGATVAAVTGSLSDLTFTVPYLRDDGSVALAPCFRERGAIEILSLQGHLGRDDAGVGRFHLHGAFALSDGRIVGGHFIKATVLATAEVTLIVGPDLGWDALPAPKMEGVEQTWMLTPAATS